jgi:hypothetical protein
VSSALVKGLARAGGGHAEFVKDTERLQTKVMTNLTIAMQPVITNLNIRWKHPEGLSIHTIPSNISNLYAGNVFLIYGMISGHANHPYELSMSVNGNCCGSEFSKTMTTIIQKSQVDINFSLHRLAAKEQIKLLENSENDHNKEDIKSNILLLSLSANLASKYSAFLGVDTSGMVKFHIMKFDEVLICKKKKKYKMVWKHIS